MTKTIRFFLVILLMATSWVAVGCSSDDDDNGGGKSSSGIVGTWRYVFGSSLGSTEDGTVLITFDSDGTGVLREQDGYYNDVEAFTYVYSKSTGMLIVTYTDGEREIYTVLSVTSNELKLLDGYDDLMVLKRVK